MFSIRWPRGISYKCLKFITFNFFPNHCTSSFNITYLHDLCWTNIESCPNITINKIVPKTWYLWSTPLHSPCCVPIVLGNDGFPPKWNIDFKALSSICSGCIQGCNLVFQLYQSKGEFLVNLCTVPMKLQ